MFLIIIIEETLEISRCSLRSYSLCFLKSRDLFLNRTQAISLEYFLSPHFYENKVEKKNLKCERSEHVQV